MSSQDLEEDPLLKDDVYLQWLPSQGFISQSRSPTVVSFVTLQPLFPLGITHSGKKVPRPGYTHSRSSTPLTIQDGAELRTSVDTEPQTGELPMSCGLQDWGSRLRLSKQLR